MLARIASQLDLVEVLIQVKVAWWSEIAVGFQRPFDRFSVSGRDFKLLVNVLSVSVLLSFLSDFARSCVFFQLFYIVSHELRWNTFLSINFNYLSYAKIKVTDRFGKDPIKIQFFIKTHMFFFSQIVSALWKRQYWSQFWSYYLWLLSQAMSFTVTKTQERLLGHLIAAELLGSGKVLF